MRIYSADIGPENTYKNKAGEAYKYCEICINFADNLAIFIFVLKGVRAVGSAIGLILN
jgi:hypothetical protein